MHSDRGAALCSPAMRPLSTLFPLALGGVLACAPAPPPTPEPVAIGAAGGEAPAEAPVASPEPGGTWAPSEATPWAEAVTRAFLAAARGEPVEGVPVAPREEGVDFVEVRDSPTGALTPRVLAVGVQVELGDGQRARVIAVFLPTGVRLGRIDPLSLVGSSSASPTPGTPAYLAPLEQLARGFADRVRAGQGAELVPDEAELRAALPEATEAMIGHAMGGAPDAATLEEVRAALLHADVHAGLAERNELIAADSAGRVFSLVGRLALGPDGDARFRSRPFVRVRRPE